MAFTRHRRRLPEAVRPRPRRQVDALKRAISGLNSAPLLVRLDRRLKEDGVPLAEEERQLLFDKLRRAHNDMAHGGVVRNAPTREDLNRGIALVARMIVHRIAGESG